MYMYTNNNDFTVYSEFYIYIPIFVVFQCVPLPGKGFEQGSYKCECRQGYEYPYQDLSWFFHGQTMEEEYDKKLQNLKNRYAGGPFKTSLSCDIVNVRSNNFANRMLV